MYEKDFYSQYSFIKDFIDTRLDNSVDDFNRICLVLYKLDNKLSSHIMGVFTSKTKDHLGNVYDNIHSMVSHYNVSLDTFIIRWKLKKLSLEETLISPVVDKETLCDPLGNVFSCLPSLALHHGVSYLTLRNRLFVGIPLNVALSLPSKGCCKSYKDCVS